jgi:hypothetical protein
MAREERLRSNVSIKERIRSSDVRGEDISWMKGMKIKQGERGCRLLVGVLSIHTHTLRDEHNRLMSVE